MTLFPLFLKLGGRRCLVVGAGPVGESKAGGLLEAGAAVRVVSPSATDRVRAWAAEGRLEWIPRRFEPADLDGALLVIAAIPAGDQLAQMAAEAGRRGVLCNAVDVPEHCDFYYPAVVRRGDFQIAISTAGHSPALAQRIRKELETRFGPDYAEWLAELGRLREALFATDMDAAERRRLLHELASGEAFERHVTGSGLGTRGSRPGPQPTAHGPQPTAQSPRPGKVFLVGAGPGHPELLTLAALRVLGTADLVLHDDLVPAEMLELVPTSARVESVGKRHGAAGISQEEIHARLVAHARAGLTVVRLKGGDVSIFGRANEEVQALDEAGIDVEIVPGVTAASAAAAAARASLTDRRASPAVVLVTARTCGEGGRPDWRALVASGATLAIYMPGRRYDRVAADLLSAHLDPETPCLIVSRASLPAERVTDTTVGALASQAGLPAPAILLVGSVVRRGDGAAGRERSSISLSDR